ncbi:unnamed protein product [Vitrella brassicaformis CCMP3155]|uniref:Piezo non-specific cation channel R-Ras-binding domain-containing protein n=1 Tax=Vitrella brassicaformis (strain CCMP3155) TaxID=1169540 RepID=A0A0G4GG78_VITBC|nr:unnamed protein product [Vitrella brassicaformis CCMP3155]|eukprot:CEM28620.1 unnamed protein product [Vitrella brassicaformis CCMP3155]
MQHSRCAIWVILFGLHRLLIAAQEASESLFASIGSNGAVTAVADAPAADDEALEDDEFDFGPPQQWSPKAYIYAHFARFKDSEDDETEGAANIQSPKSTSEEEETSQTDHLNGASLPDPNVQRRPKDANATMEEPPVEINDEEEEEFEYDTSESVDQPLPLRPSPAPQPSDEPPPLNGDGVAQHDNTTEDSATDGSRGPSTMSIITSFLWWLFHCIIWWLTRAMTCVMLGWTGAEVVGFVMALPRSPLGSPGAADGDKGDEGTQQGTSQSQQDSEGGSSSLQPEVLDRFTLALTFACNIWCFCSVNFYKVGFVVALVVAAIKTGSSVEWQWITGVVALYIFGQLLGYDWLLQPIPYVPIFSLVVRSLVAFINAVMLRDLVAPPSSTTSRQWADFCRSYDASFLAANPAIARQAKEDKDTGDGRPIYQNQYDDGLGIGFNSPWVLVSSWLLFAYWMNVLTSLIIAFDIAVSLGFTVWITQPTYMLRKLIADEGMRSCWSFTFLLHVIILTLIDLPWISTPRAWRDAYWRFPESFQRATRATQHHHFHFHHWMPKMPKKALTADTPRSSNSTLTAATDDGQQQPLSATPTHRTLEDFLDEISIARFNQTALLGSGRDGSGYSFHYHTHRDVPPHLSLPLPSSIDLDSLINMAALQDTLQLTLMAGLVRDMSHLPYPNLGGIKVPRQLSASLQFPRAFNMDPFFVEMWTELPLPVWSSYRAAVALLGLVICAVMATRRYGYWVDGPHTLMQPGTLFCLNEIVFIAIMLDFLFLCGGTFYWAHFLCAFLITMLASILLEKAQDDFARCEPAIVDDLHRSFHFSLYLSRVSLKTSAKDPPQPPAAAAAATGPSECQATFTCSDGRTRGLLVRPAPGYTGPPPDLGDGEGILQSDIDALTAGCSSTTVSLPSCMRRLFCTSTYSGLENGLSMDVPVDDVFAVGRDTFDSSHARYPHTLLTLQAIYKESGKHMAISRPPPPEPPGMTPAKTEEEIAREAMRERVRTAIEAADAEVGLGPKTYGACGMGLSLKGVRRAAENLSRKPMLRPEPFAASSGSGSGSPQSARRRSAEEPFRPTTSRQPSPSGGPEMTYPREQQAAATAKPSPSPSPPPPQSPASDASSRSTAASNGRRQGGGDGQTKKTPGPTPAPLSPSRPPPAEQAPTNDERDEAGRKGDRRFSQPPTRQVFLPLAIRVLLLYCVFRLLSGYTAFLMMHSLRRKYQPPGFFSDPATSDIGGVGVGLGVRRVADDGSELQEPGWSCLAAALPLIDCQAPFPYAYRTTNHGMVAMPFIQQYPFLNRTFSPPVVHLHAHLYGPLTRSRVAVVQPPELLQWAPSRNRSAPATLASYQSAPMSALGLHWLDMGIKWLVSGLLPSQLTTTETTEASFEEPPPSNGGHALDDHLTSGPPNGSEKVAGGEERARAVEWVSGAADSVTAGSGDVSASVPIIAADECWPTRHLPPLTYPFCTFQQVGFWDPLPTIAVDDFDTASALYGAWVGPWMSGTLAPPPGQTPRGPVQFYLHLHAHLNETLSRRGLGAYRTF